MRALFVAFLAALAHALNSDFWILGDTSDWVNAEAFNVTYCPADNAARQFTPLSQLVLYLQPKTKRQPSIRLTDVEKTLNDETHCIEIDFLLPADVATSEYQISIRRPRWWWFGDKTLAVSPAVRITRMDQPSLQEIVQFMTSDMHQSIFEEIPEYRDYLSRPSIVATAYLNSHGKDALCNLKPTSVFTVSLVQLMHAKGADVFCNNAEPIKLALITRKLDIVEWLLTEARQQNRTDVFDAASKTVAMYRMDDLAQEFQLANPSEEVKSSKTKKTKPWKSWKIFY